MTVAVDIVHKSVGANRILHICLPNQDAQVLVIVGVVPDNKVVGRLASLAEM